MRLQRRATRLHGASVDLPQQQEDELSRDHFSRARTQTQKHTRPHVMRV